MEDFPSLVDQMVSFQGLVFPHAMHPVQRELFPSMNQLPIQPMMRGLTPARMTPHYQRMNADLHQAWLVETGQYEYPYPPGRGTQNPLYGWQPTETNVDPAHFANPFINPFKR